MAVLSLSTPNRVIRSARHSSATALSVRRASGLAGRRSVVRVAAAADDETEAADVDETPTTSEPSPESTPEVPELALQGELPSSVLADEIAAIYDGKPVLVAGATGRTGKAVVEKLVGEGVPVVALVRDIAKSEELLPSEGVTIVKGDVYQYSTLGPALAGCGAVVCATGANNPLDVFAPFNVDYTGTKNLVCAAKAEGITKMVLVSSIGVDEANPLFVTAFWGILFWKKRGEEELQRSGIDYTIVRPGGLRDSLREGQSRGNIMMTGPGALGLPPKKTGGILRSQVADVCAEALIARTASNKVVEIISDPDADDLPVDELFGLQW